VDSKDRASLVVLGAAAFMVQADARVIDTLLHSVSQDFHTIPAKASIVISSYTLPYGMFQLLYGPIGDRVGKLRVTALCFALFAVGTFVCGFVPSLASFAALRFLTGVAAAAVVPMSLSYIGDKFPYEGRQAALARFMSALMMGQVLGSTLGGIFGQYLGWRTVFFAFGAGALLISIVLGRESGKFPEAKKPGKALTSSMFTVPLGGTILFLGMLRLWSLAVTAVLVAIGVALLLYALATQYSGLLVRKKVQAVLGIVGIEGLFVFGALAYLPSSLTDRFGMSTIAAGLVMAGFGIGGLLYSLSVKKLVARIGELGILILGGSVMGVALVTIGAVSNWHAYVPLVLILGTGFYTMHGTLQTRATEMAPEARGTAISLFAFSFFMGQALGPIALGRILEWHGYSAAFLTAGFGLFLLALTGRMLFARLRRVS
jgi:YNFM family putative membrane transporter